ncbi:aminotransferase class V-fold PLP-dependent enzyme [Streptomyces sp. H27-C3]|uniref:pyridoxal phosphate-dependent decarboxylase family protein n=1 Tax=Streptomyces sp. H27-C3 TaxID=3046305 RepID=UPI0024B8B697|nr:aminotransferase class V-fold PLP-dependent enzyme [Streptomyces sp. H27-C3]MDJ0461680.1 aminotransferase class V-fold PLP-dependent enzyme [Streptomyces sp. H27-C3]
MSTPPPPGTAIPPLAGGVDGPTALRPLLATVLDALHEGAVARGGPLPAGGPDAVAKRLRDAVGPVIPAHGSGAEEALHTLVRALAEGAADPADPRCAAHLHCPPLAVATAADLAASALNQSMDSWDQAPAASALEAAVTQAVAAEVYPGTAAATGTASAPTTDFNTTLTAPATPDALVTTGGTESNQLALLLARERHGAVQLICGANAHHSLRRAAWLLGLPEPVTVPAPSGVIDLVALDEALTDLHHPRLVAATAGTTDTGRIDPIPEIADLCARHNAELHIDAAYGGPLLFSDRHRGALDGLDRAHSVTLDLHKLGWQPVAAGLLVVPDRRLIDVLRHQADYLNAEDDTEAGLPDLLGRSLRTTRRPDILKVAATLRALGRSGLGDLVDRTLAAARELADLVEKSPHLELYERPALSTVLFRPAPDAATASHTATAAAAAGSDETVADIRRTLLTEGRAVLGRARIDGRLWLKATLLNPHTTTSDLEALLNLLEGRTHR